MPNEGKVYTSVLRECDVVGRSLLDYLAAAFVHSSRDEWASHLCVGRVLLDGEQADADTKARPGATLAYHRLPWEEPAAPRSLPVLFFDGSLLAVRKPSGLPTLPSELYWEHTVLESLQRGHAAGAPPATVPLAAVPPAAFTPRPPFDPASTGTGEAAAAAPAHLAPADTPAAAGAGGAMPATLPPVPVHRLGVGTSGVLLCAADAAVRSQLQRALQVRRTSTRAPVNTSPLTPPH